MILQGLKNNQYDLPDTPKFTGGEGSIYFTSDGKVVKIYKPAVLSNHPELSSKIEYMLQNPPGNTLRYMAWPIDVVYNQGVFCGFVMNNLSNYKELKTLHGYNLSNPQNQRLKLQVAYNLCKMVEILHNHGYIIGDFNPKNIGYDSAGYVCFFDNDSFQFTDKNGKLYRCGVDFRGYIAPEIMDETEKIAFEKFQRTGRHEKIEISDLVEGFTFNTDRFALAVHIFQLMMNGQMPYSSKEPRVTNAVDQYQNTSISSSSAPAISDEENVRNDHYCFNTGRIPYSEFVPLEKYFPSYITSLFHRAFCHISGNQNRPSAYEWTAALNQYADSLTNCKKVSQHAYWDVSTICPYCDADQRWTNVQKKNKVVKNNSPNTRNNTYYPNGMYVSPYPQAPTFPANYQPTNGIGVVSNAQPYVNDVWMNRLSLILIGLSIGLISGAFIPDGGTLGMIVSAVSILGVVCRIFALKDNLLMSVWVVIFSIVGAVASYSICASISVNILAIVSTAIMSMGLLVALYARQPKNGNFLASFTNNGYTNKSILSGIIFGIGIGMVVTSLVLIAGSTSSFFNYVVSLLMIIVGSAIIVAVYNSKNLYKYVPVVISMFYSYWIVSLFFASNNALSAIMGIIICIAGLLYDSDFRKAIW